MSAKDFAVIALRSCVANLEAKEPNRKHHAIRALDQAIFILQSMMMYEKANEDSSHDARET